jgi:hypothetical protein
MAAQHSSAAGALDFLNLVGLLKKLKRTGWVREGVHLPESVAGKLESSCDRKLLPLCSLSITFTSLVRLVSCLLYTNRSSISHGYHELLDHRSYYRRAQMHDGSTGA